MNRLKTTNNARFRSFNREPSIHNEISFFSSVQQNYPILLSEYHLRSIGSDGTQTAKAGSTKNQPVKTYYALVNIEDRRLGAYVSAENVADAFKTATDRYKTRHPRLRVETIAVQEMADEYLNGIWREPAVHAV